MSRCDLHCPTPGGFPWLATLIAAAIGLALWGVGHLLQTARPVLTGIGAAGLFFVASAVWLFITDAIAATPGRVRRPRYSELTALVDETAAPVDEPTYQPLRAVPDIEERAA